MARRTSVAARATLHEKAVQAVARGETDPPRRSRRKPEEKILAWVGGRNITVLRAAWVPTRAWVDAKGLPSNCIEIISESDVIVHNHPVGKRSR